MNPEEYYKFILDLQPCGIMLVGRDRKIKFANKVFYQQFQLKECIAGKPLTYWSDNYVDTFNVMRNRNRLEFIIDYNTIGKIISRDTPDGGIIVAVFSIDIKPLTKKERQILFMLIERNSVRKISEKLKLHPNTIYTYKKRLNAKYRRLYDWIDITFQ